MTPIHICEWKQLRISRWDALLLGNGSSIALHDEFAYRSLLREAKRAKLLETTLPLFSEFKTSSFERVLEALWYASRVNAALGLKGATVQRAYDEVKQALIRIVRAVHCAPSEIEQHLLVIGMFMRSFRTIVSMNYDVMVYWAMLEANKVLGTWFKDCFIDRAFDQNWDRLRAPYVDADGASLVFYPHGNLVLAKDAFGQETKLIATEERNLLNQVTAAWENETHIPLFVTEGTSNDKLRAIRRSSYLSTVYDDVLTTLGDNVAVFGFSFGDNDKHILQAIAHTPPRLLAVSVYGDTEEDAQQIFCHQVLATVREMLGAGVRVVFFDSESDGCWRRYELSSRPPMFSARS